LVWPERKPWITDPSYIAMPADDIFALVPMVATASLCVFSAFGGRCLSLDDLLHICLHVIGYFRTA
jgi:hypothetical protein